MEERRARLVGMAGVGAVVVASVVQLLRATRYGIDVSNDSMYYLGGTQSLRLGHGFLMRPGAVIVWHAPGYAFALLPLAFIHHNLLDDARWLNTGLLLATVALVAVLVRRAGAGWAATVVATAAIGLSQPFLRAYSFAWSETLFLPFVLAGIIALALYLAGGDRRVLLAAGLAFAAACLARYTGFPLVAAGVVLVVGRRSSWRSRVIDGSLFAVSALALPAAWLVRNRIRTGTFTGRHVSNRLPPASVLVRGARTGAAWVLPSAGRGPAIVVAVALMAMVALAVGAVVRRRANPESVVTAAMLAAYLVGLGLSRVFVDHRIPLDGRILLPAQVLVIVLVGLALPDVALDARALAWGVASVCVVAIALDSQLWIAAHHRHVRYVQRRDAPLVLDGPPRRLPVPISPRD